MNRQIRSVFLVPLVAFALLPAASVAGPDAYPAKPVTLMVGYQAGGSVDLVARAIGPSLARRLGQSVVVENAAGAGGTIAAAKVARAEPDGYTLLVGSPSEVGINHLTNKNLNYHPVRDFKPIGLVGTQPMVLVAGPKLPVSNTDEFVKYVALHPDKSMYASAGVGTPLHLAGEMVKQKAKLSMVHIPYRGAASMATDLLGGQIEFSVFVLSSALPYIKDGRMKAIGVTSATRAAVAPDVPALAEHPKLREMDLTLWFGLLAPSGTPEPVVKKLRAELRAVLAEPEVARKLQESGVTLSGNVDFAKFLKGEIDKYSRIVDLASITQ